MKHRIITETGLGNPSKCFLDNNIKFPKKLHEFGDDLIETFSTINLYGGFDFKFIDNRFLLGIEPPYERDRLEIICFDLNNKNDSFWLTGIAFGPYGTGIRKSYKFYSDYKRQGKFTQFVDKWYEIVKKELNKFNK